MNKPIMRLPEMCLAYILLGVMEPHERGTPEHDAEVARITALLDQRVADGKVVKSGRGYHLP